MRWPGTGLPEYGFLNRYDAPGADAAMVGLAQAMRDNAASTDALFADAPAP